ncbi:MAG TPA: cellulase family glycosylhydrolase [Devosia sp.]|nr:cellulase family glycosylhydrolase [Devosia sp.]
MKIAAKAGLVLALFLTSFPAFAGDTIGFWDTQRKGSNFFSVKPLAERFAEAHAAGIQWGRLAYDKWDATGRDFLIGDADHYEGLVQPDLAKLKQVLGMAHDSGIGMVITPLSLPGMRWSQNNGNKFDGRLWQDKAYWQQAADFWRDLAAELKDNPGVLAYNIVNEPAPERGTGAAENTAPGDVSSHVAFLEQNKGTARDLPAFYEMVIAAIRSVDPDTPIMVDAGWYANAGAFSGWPDALSDDKVLYAFHMYEPYSFTAGRNFRDKLGYVYPGTVPFGTGGVAWNASTINAFLQPVYDWADKHAIPANRIVAAEFGCMRRNEGCAQYLTDVMANLNAHDIHWAFYSFREDEYDGFDYELGSDALGWKYWEALEKGLPPVMPYKPNPLWDAIQAGLHE